MIEFRVENNLLILIYEPVGNPEWIFKKLRKQKAIPIKKTFVFKRKDLFEQSLDKNLEKDYDGQAEFIFGKLVEDNYYKINRNKLDISKDVFIHKDIKITWKFFIASRGVSIFRKIDKLLNEDIYIGGEKDSHIPKEEFNKMLDDFPKEGELEKYVDARLSTVLINYFNTTVDSEEKYKDYMNKKISIKGKNIYKMFKKSELVKYKAIYEELKRMLKDEANFNEKEWQKEMHKIILLLYPKYINVFDEALVEAGCKKRKRLDYLLVDAGGNIDIIEIKKPSNDSIVRPTKYRNNYTPALALSKTIMQIEKYIYYLNRWGKKGEDCLIKRYKRKLPEGFSIKIINPSGLIIMGRDNGLSPDQKSDFEVIRRKYKNVIDILTYDDLLRRLNFIISQLESNNN
ncbi:MAG: DUF4263 domain-containing protein [Candidatus Pacebacteria bacterium]|nr:DUF4263 domain-containing protein [Candidatus Paceibacterota bacterium]